jgi:hypothetical protein
MPSEATLAPEERFLLKELPFKAILAAVIADVRGPVGASRVETANAAQSLVSEAQTTYAGNPLIQGVLQDVASDTADEAEIPLKDDDARHAAMVDALRMCSAGATVLDGWPDEAEAAQYKEWVYTAAKAAVEATRSGSILNFSHVSDDEEDFLRQLQVALGLITDDAAG